MSHSNSQVFKYTLYKQAERLLPSNTKDAQQLLADALVKTLQHLISHNTVVVLTQYEMLFFKHLRVESKAL